MSIFKKKKEYFFESFQILATYSKEALEILEEGLLNFESSF